MFPELDLALRLILDETPETTEYELITKLRAKPFELFATEQLPNELDLFRVHFTVMNSLYRLQKTLLVDGMYLSISSVKISLTHQTSLLVEEADNRLRDYYLDLTNLKGTTEQQVADLLDSFWQRFHFGTSAQPSASELKASLNYFGLIEEPTLTDLKILFKRECANCHPDKGGSHEDFVKLKHHYEVIKRAI